MKLIPKEFVKGNCTEKHKTVLCSYIIKTFLFLQFEKTNATFWRTNNLICCLEYLFKEFFNCVQTGVLRLYFIPRSNLFEIKLNQHAQIELLHLYQKVKEFGILILGQCKSLSGVFSKFRQVSERGQSEMRKEKIIINRILDNDETLMSILTPQVLETMFSSARNASYEDFLFAVEKCTYKGQFPRVWQPLSSDVYASCCQWADWLLKETNPCIITWTCWIKCSWNGHSFKQTPSSLAKVQSASLLSPSADWSILRRMPNLCSVDIFKRLCTSPVIPIHVPAYRMRMSVACWPRV